MLTALFSTTSSVPPTSSDAVRREILPANHTNVLFKTFNLAQNRNHCSLHLTRSVVDNGPSSSGVVVEGEKVNKGEIAPAVVAVEEKEKKEVESTVGSNGAAADEQLLPKFNDPRWVGGTWELKQFEKDGKTDWDTVIDAEARRRKWFEENPEFTNIENHILFDTSIVPWWAWMKKYHLPEAELLNGRAAMIGFFMAYSVDSLTGLGVVDQMSNFICKTLLFVAVAGVLLVRKNEDVDNLKKLLGEITLYDKQWQATWLEDSSKKE